MRSVPIILSALISTILEEIVVSRTVGISIVQRAKCVILAYRKLKHSTISERVGLSPKTVGQWVSRFRESLEALEHIEQKGVRAKLVIAIFDCLRDAPRSGRPPKFTAAQVASVVSIACEDPAKSGRPVTYWTSIEIADEAKLRHILPSISKSQVDRYLKRAQLCPHKKKGWCFTTEKDQDLFQQQVEAVCQTYINAPRLMQDHNVYTVCVDEVTGLQANEKRAPGKLPAPGQCGKEESQYTRHGAVCMTGNWDVVNGQFIHPTIEITRNNKDFARHIERLISLVKADGWVFVVDNLNTHCGEELVRMVAKHLGIPSDKLGQVKKCGILKTMATRRAFLSDPSHKIRFVYIPKHSSWLNQIEAIFCMISRRVMRGGNFTSREDLIEKLKRFTTYFNEHIAKPMLWTFTGRPTEKESVETPKTWRQLWPFRKLRAILVQPEGT
jgi:transposase